MPPLSSHFLNPIPPVYRWLGALTAANVVGLSTRSGPTGSIGSNVAPSGEGGKHVDLYT